MDYIEGFRLRCSMYPSLLKHLLNFCNPHLSKIFDLGGRGHVGLILLCRNRETLAVFDLMIGKPRFSNSSCGRCLVTS
jgi:hypothetical protein